jgi:hypothetical protein
LHSWAAAAFETSKARIAARTFIVFPRDEPEEIGAASVEGLRRAAGVTGEYGDISRRTIMTRNPARLPPLDAGVY